MTTTTPRRTSARKAPAKKLQTKLQTKNNFLHDAFVASQARLILAEQQLEALHFIFRDMSNSRSIVNNEVDALRGVIYQRIVTAQRDVITFGALIGGEAEREAKYIAHLTFLNERYSIMQMLNHYHGGEGAGYYTQDENEFKAQIKAAVTCTDPNHDHKRCNAPGMVSNIHDLEQQLLHQRERYEAFVGQLVRFDQTPST